MRKVLLFLLPALLFCSTFFYLTGKPLNQWLQLNRPCANAKLLVVEGWLNLSELEFARKTFHEGNYQFMVCTGYKTPPAYEMGMNGDLLFNIDSSNAYLNDSLVKIIASGVELNVENSEFAVFINDTLAGHFYTKNYPDTFTVIVKSRFVNEIKIRFLNDAVVGNIDRNLYPYGIIFNQKFISVNLTNVSYRVYQTHDTAIYYLGNTMGERAAQYMVHNGILKSSIITIGTETSDISRTLSSARETIDKLSVLFPNPTSLNLITSPIHSRRTYSTYKNIAPENWGIGVIPIPKNKHQQNENIGRRRKIKELMGTIMAVFHF